MTLKLHHTAGAKSHIHHIRARNKRVIFRIFPIEPEGSQERLSSLLRHREVVPQPATEFNPPGIPSYEDIDIEQCHIFSHGVCGFMLFGNSS